ncbi:hypothetical protein GCM10010470_31520 [Saccharopolyspora taberi]|uniref:Sulfotransferase family protein n=2 Tax=Saccharopolyspora taberi TaxID=60895 RepID=A0ABN3VEE6_9PSEU
MFEVIAQPTRIRPWASALDGERVDWDQVFAGFESTVDWPGCAFWQQLMERYPDAKVVLTVRDPLRWYESTYNTIYQFVKNGSEADERFGADPDMLALRPTIERMVWNGTFDGRFEDRDHAIEVFERHNAEVQRIVPPERLLVFEVKQGWGPLCEFLGVDVPEEDFPHVNDSASMTDLAEQIRSEGRVPSPFAGQG